MSEGRNLNDDRAGQNPALGLSNRPYSADVISGSQETRELDTWKKFQRIKSKKGKITESDWHFIRNEGKYWREQIGRYFENRNGFPISWLKHESEKKFHYERGVPRYHLTVHPYMISLSIRGYYMVKGKTDVTRDVIRNYSEKSRSNLHGRLLKVNWEDIDSDRIRIGTLTYPEHFPKNGETVKRHLRNLIKRLERYGDAFGGVTVVWKLEFQKRGAPHFHLLVVSKETMGLEGLREWLAKNWAEVVNEWTLLESGLSREEKEEQFKKHLQAGTELDGIKSKMGSMNYFSFYIGRGNEEKEIQQQVPEGFKKVGRWWGICGDSDSMIPIRMEEREIPADVFDRLWEKMDRHLLSLGVVLNPYATGRKVFFQSPEETRKFIDSLFENQEPPRSAEEQPSTN